MTWFRDLPVFWKLLVPFALLLVLVGSVGTYLLVRDQANRVQASLDRDLVESSVRARGVVQQREVSLLEAANLAANVRGMATALQDGDAGVAATLLQSVAALKPDLALLASLGPTGDPLVAIGPLGTPVDATALGPAVTPLATAARQDGDKSSDLVILGSDVQLAIAASVCDTDCTGSVVVADALDGVVAAAADALDVAGRPDAGITILSPDGDVLASVGRVADGVRRAELGRELLRRRDTQGEVVDHLYAPLEVGGRVVGTIAVTEPRTAALASVRTAGRQFAALVGLILLGIVGIGAAVSRSVLRQVRAVVRTSEDLARGDLSARVPSPSRDEVGRIAVAMNRMADELQASHGELERRVQDRTAQVEQLLRQRTEFFASLSHELRTPLAIILSQSDLLLLDEDSDEVARSGRAIHQSADHLLGVVNEILELARAEVGELVVEPRPVPVEPFLATLSPLLESLVTQADMRLHIDLADGVPDAIADPSRLRDIVVNLVDNAAKYGAPDTDVRIAVCHEAGRLRWRVRDHGPGIPPHVGDRIFEPFHRVPGSTPRPGTSATGLGLSLARHLVEAQGGTLHYESTTGAGTVFEFDLPAVSN